MLPTFRVAAIIVLCNLYCLKVRGQNIDSIMLSNAADSSKALALGNYAFSISDSKPDSSLLIAGKALTLATHTKNKKIYAQCLMDLGWAYFKSGKYDSAKQCLSDSKMLFHKCHDTTLEVRVMENMSSISNYEGNYEAALNQLLAAIQLLGYSRGAEYAFTEKMIGIIYRQQGDFVNAKVYLKKAAADYLQLKNLKSYADATGSLGNVYLGISDNDSAIYCYHKALTIYLQLKKISSAAISYEDLGDAFVSKSDLQPLPWLDSALDYYQHAYNLFCELKSKQDIAVEKYKLGQALTKKKQYPLARKYLFEALAEFRSENAINNIYLTLLLLSRLYYEMHDYNKAYVFLDNADLYNDTLNQESKNKAIADMLAKYETEKKDHTIALLNTQNTLLNTKKKLAEYTLYKRRIIESFSLALITLSVFLAIALFNRSRIKQRLHEMQMRNRISGDLHDDVGNSISSILLLSKMAAADGGNNAALINKISENAHEVIERINDIIWTTNPKYDDGENLRSKIMNYIVPLCKMNNITLNINISETINNIKFAMESRKNIFLIAKEGISNILKHSGATEINFELTLRDKKITLEIRDNGTGFDSNIIYKGNGLHTMSARAESSGGKLLLDTHPGNGTKLLITIPLSRIPYS